MERKQVVPSIWKTAPVETGTLALLLLGWGVVNLMGWVPDVNSSLVALGVYAAWLILCVIVYRFFYRWDG